MLWKNMKFYFSLIVALSMGLSSLSTVYSQATLNLQIDNMKDQDYPSLEVYVAVSDEHNAPVHNLDINNFSLAEAGQSVSAFTVRPVYEKGLAVVLAIDISQSMGLGTPASFLARSVAQAKNLVATLASEDQVAVIAFSSNVVVAQELTTDKSKVVSALDGLQPGKNAALYSAIAQSALLLDNFSGRRAVILFTDSADAGFGKYTLDQALNIAIEKNVTVFPVFWNDASSKELIKLASLTNGKSLNIGPQDPFEKDFLAATTQIKTELTALREQYLIRYTSALPATGTETDITVKVDYKGAHSEQSRKFTTRAGSVAINLKNLKDGQNIAGNVEIIPEVTAPGDVSKLEVFIDDKLVDTVSGEPFKYVWNSTKTSIGNHTLKVTVTDTVGNTGSQTMMVNVQVPVTVKIISPLADTVIDRPIPIEIDVISAKPISYIEVILDNDVLQKIDAPTSYPIKYDFNPSNTPAGKHQLTVKAYAPDGFSGEFAISLSLAPGGSASGAWVAILVILALGGILIPLGLRSRRVRSNSVVPASNVGASNRTATLIEVEGMNPGQTWPLNDAEIRIGRKSAENHIVLKGIGASRYHAVIRRNGDQVILFVLNPANPVVINYLAVTSQKVLESGDIIQAGESTFRFDE